MLTKFTLYRFSLILLMTIFALFSLAGVGQAQIGGSTSDLGDAPDSSNSAATAMSAYKDVPAQFPTVFGSVAPFGPKHLNDTLSFYLGSALSREDEADTGFDADVDGINNLDLATQRADLDGGDDGFSFLNLAGHCQATQLQFTVTVTELGAQRTGPMLLNLWLDWDRSGQWGDATSLGCVGGNADEWAVQNQPITVSAPGTYTFVTSAFLNWDPASGQPLWVRATLSDTPATSADGSGPRAGYPLGETEDYLVRPQHRILLPFAIGGAADETTLEEVEVGGEFTEPDDIRATWPQLPEGDASAVVGLNELQLQIDEQAGVARDAVSVELSIFANGTHTAHTLTPSRVTVSGTVTLTVALGDLGIDPTALRAPGRMEATVVATDTTGAPYVAGTERIFFHGHESAPKMMVIYGRDAAARQFSGLTFDHNPGLSARMAGMMPTGLDLTDTEEIGIYDSSDPILREPPVDPVADEAGPEAEPIPDPEIPTLMVDPASTDAPMTSYVVCLRLLTSVVESSRGDLGRSGYWRGRGAHVIIYHDGKKMWNGWLNIYGCMTLNSNRSGPIVVSYQGEHKLRVGGNTMRLDILRSTASNASFDHVKGTAVVHNPSTSGVNVAPLLGFDAMAILAYGIQERIFDSGLDGQRLWVKHIGCGDEKGGGACSSKKVGKEILFLDPTNLSHRKKFTIMHEFGHALVKMAASGWRQDCSWGPKDASYHSRQKIEYSSCAAGEGFAHFISTAAWNLREGPNPDAVFEGFNVENGGANTALCRQQNKLNCDGWGVEVDWMRHLWDFYSNNRPEDPGSPPSIAQMVNIYDDADWKKDGQIHSSKRIEKHLGGAMLERWIYFGCYNGIRECN